MIAVTQDDALVIIASGELVEHRVQAGKEKSIKKYKTESGYVVEFMTEGHVVYFYMDFSEECDNSVTELLRAMTSRLSDEDRELELYRWGLEKIKEATTESFGEYRVLITDKKGALDWHREDGKTVLFSALEKAKEACCSKLLSRLNPMVV